MKTTNIIILVATTLLTFTGCKKYLDKMPDDQLTMEMIFNDKIRTEDWLAGVYSGVPSPMWGYFKDQGFNIMGDDITIPAEWSPFGWKNVYAYTVGDWNPSSGWNPYYWIELPKRIRSGLIFLENVKPLPGVTAEDVEVMKGQVRFLIAYYYSLMIELYGPIPFKPGVIEAVDASAAELMTTQSPYDVIVDWIDTELKDVAGKLPAVYSDQHDWGKATSIMALAIRARTLLFAASPLFNGNPDLQNWKNADGENMFKQSYDVAKWAKAAAACKELIDAAESAGYGLYYEYNADGSIDPFMSYYNLSLRKFSDGNKEIIFGRPDNPDLNSWLAHHLPIGIGGNGGMGVTQELVDAFYMKNGLSIGDPNSGYTESGFSTQDEIRTTKWTGGGPNTGVVTTAGTYNMYVNREPRFYVSVIFDGAWLGVDKRKAEFVQGGRDTRLTFDAPQNGYNVRKAVSLDVFPRENRYNYQPGILYRLAEAYLSYAEALNESDPDNPDILKYVNLIRERAGIPSLTAGMSQAQMREAIRKERQIEFNCEGIRFNDIRRWKIGEETLNRQLFGMNFTGSVRSDDSGNPNAFFKRTFYKNRIFNKKMYLWPVPQAQMDINPNLVQAPGY
ncbi:RagB/SusD family nutrient uptake outer membrane protein [Olivibacter ginsenosidimutans]|uniref:RagB/SusD family nutrient uptake outer membrane protein n=1 Tax=Olivibacter ginsenosidimutans TaxID=1176537 RepID=A0ABP9BY50_9SPHI